MNHSRTKDEGCDQVKPVWSHGKIHIENVASNSICQTEIFSNEKLFSHYLFFVYNDISTLAAYAFDPDGVQRRMLAEQE